VFERFTDSAREVVVSAQDEARTLRHNYIGTEHLLLGLLRGNEGIAAQVLESFGITLDDVRAQVARIIGHGDELPSGQMPFAPRAKKVLELSLREALALGHNYISTEHILLGLVRENEGVASRILLDFGASARSVAERVVEAIPTERREYAETFADGMDYAGTTGTWWPHGPWATTGAPRGWAFPPGWLLFAISLGIGILIGWAIWG
jgi:ATP-dependent Clp protease ATP-binding subunit ClpC